MRPAHILVGVLFIIFIGDFLLILYSSSTARDIDAGKRKIDVVVGALGLTDLCVSTEARYTRHPAVSDAVVPFMDYPGAYEHFPTGSFWAPVSRRWNAAL